MGGMIGVYDFETAEEPMNKLLKEIRKGEEDNILPFDAIPKPEMKPPDGPDWLRSLPTGTRFLARKKGTVSQVFLELFGIGMITDKSVLLAYESEYGPAMQMKYVDSAEFSRRYIHHETLPEMKPLEEGDGDNDGRDGEDHHS
jgi:hypothetical protein